MSRPSLSKRLFLDQPGVLQLDAEGIGVRLQEPQLPAAAQVLILAKEMSIQHSCCRAADVAGFSYSVFRSTSGAYSALASDRFRVAVLYLRWPADQGMDILERIKRMQPKVAVIVLAGYGTVQSAVYAMKLGAYDYLMTPVKLEELALALTGAMRDNRLAPEQSEALPNLTLQKSRADAEKNVILSALNAVHGNKDRAARLLGIGRTTLYQKLKQIASRNGEQNPLRTGVSDNA